MTLKKMNRPYYRAILTGTVYATVLQSSMLMAASFEKSEDPIPGAAYGEAALPRMEQGTTLPSAPLEEPAVRTGRGNTIPNDAASILSDHGSDDEELKGFIREARLKGHQGDGEVKEQISRIRGEKKQIKQAAVEASRREFLGMLRQRNLLKAEADGGASSAGGSASSAAGSGSPATATAAADAMVAVPRGVPATAVGHEALYRRFLEGRLEYRPTAGSDAGLIILPFRDILAPLAEMVNPLSATFDLAPCGDAGKYISLNIGYKKAKIPANEHKVEVWICPKFLVEKELSTTASSLARIMGRWESPVGYFWTWGGDDVGGSNYDYLLEGIAMDNDKNLYELWQPTTYHPMYSGLFSPTPQPPPNATHHIFFYLLGKFSCKIL